MAEGTTEDVFLIISLNEYWLLGKLKFETNKKYFFLYYGKKVMTYTMTKKTPFRFPTERYLNVVKRGYKDCKLDKKYLSKALIS